MDPNSKSRKTLQVLYRLSPMQYIHVHDLNRNIVRVEIGPQTFARKDNESIVLGPETMVIIPPEHYCIVQNPIQRKPDSAGVEYEASGQAKLSHGDHEVRFTQDPFPLYPGEVIKCPVAPLPIVGNNVALCLRANTNFCDENNITWTAGDEWLYMGPGTYRPRKEVEIVKQVDGVVIEPLTALHLRAKRAFRDERMDGKNRVAGEEWMIREIGTYLPGAYEEVANMSEGIVLTDNNALQLCAKCHFTDCYGVERRTGEEWLVTKQNADVHIPDVYEKIVEEVKLEALTNRQWCIICDPLDTNSGHNQLGKKKLVKGPATFFLQPGEKLSKEGIQDVYVLEENEGLVLQCLETFEDSEAAGCSNDTSEGGSKETQETREEPLIRKPGDRWLIRGPREYIPPTEVVVFDMRKTIALDDHEGIYVRDQKTGKVRAVIGKAYMLTEYEEPWTKPRQTASANLSAFNLSQLALCENQHSTRMSTQSRSLTLQASQQRYDSAVAVSYRLPPNTVLQLYDYREKRKRTAFGPTLVILQPEEEVILFTMTAGIITLFFTYVFLYIRIFLHALKVPMRQ